MRLEFDLYRKVLETKPGSKDRYTVKVNMWPVIRNDVEISGHIDR